MNEDVIARSGTWGPSQVVRLMPFTLSRPSGGSYSSEFCSALDQIVHGGNMLIANGVEQGSKTGVWVPGKSGE